MTRVLALEILASVSTLAGMAVGSTTAPGAALYCVSLVFWWSLVFERRMYGLIPLNLGSTAVSLWNLWSAFS